MTPILYQHSDSPNCRKVRLMFAAIQVEHELRPIDLPGGQTRSPEFLAINPRGQVPVLVHGALTLPESNAILLYLAARYAPELGGQTIEDRAQIERWLFWQSGGPSTVVAAISYQRLLCPALGREPDEAVVARELPAWRRQSEVLEGHLRASEWLSSALSVADLAVGAWVELACWSGMLEEMPATRAWFERLRALPLWSQAQGYQLLRGQS